MKPDDRPLIKAYNKLRREDLQEGIRRNLVRIEKLKRQISREPMTFGKRSRMTRRIVKYQEQIAADTAELLQL